VTESLLVLTIQYTSVKLGKPKQSYQRAFPCWQQHTGQAIFFLECRHADGMIHKVTDTTD